MRRIRSANCGSDSTPILETVVLVWDSGTEEIIHAMKCRSQYLSLLD